LPFAICNFTTRSWQTLVCTLLTLSLWQASAQSTLDPTADPLLKQRWFEVRTPHFYAYSCGDPQQVARLVERLEQFRQTYSLLAGAQAVASPPIVVMVFPDQEAMQPYLPLYHGRPANMTAFFQRGSDENLIVLPLLENISLEAVFHEYTHLLLRHNDRFWPLWLKESMAEIYSTFEVLNGHTARIGQPKPRHLRLLNHEPMLPLASLFAIAHDSPGYNEADQQGMFYAQSWLLTHFLMLGDKPEYKARFKQLTPLLKQGESAEAAFKNAFQTSLPSMEADLRRYLEAGKFNYLDLAIPENLWSRQEMVSRVLSPVEVCFRLGVQLIRVGRFEDAQAIFSHAKKLAPASPLPYEGLGLLAAEQRKHELAVRFLHEALQRGGGSFLAHYDYAFEAFQGVAQSPDKYGPLDSDTAAELRRELEKSLTLMPEFGPAHRLLGVVEILQGENFTAAERHLERAVQLEPENESYALSLGQAQLLKGDEAAARRTLEALRRPYIDAVVRMKAEELLKQIGRTGN
jgi:tetratricopeptide (TPR) repeat protein